MHRLLQVYRIHKVVRPYQHNFSSLSQAPSHLSRTSSTTPPPPPSSNVSENTSLQVAASAPLIEFYEDDVLDELYTPPLPSTQPVHSAVTRPTRMRDAFMYGPGDESAYTRQLALEEETLTSAVERFEKMNADASQRGDVSTLRTANDLLVAWYNPFILALRGAVETPPKSGRASSLEDTADNATAKDSTNSKANKLSASSASGDAKKRPRRSGRRNVGELGNDMMTQLQPESLAIIVIHTLLSTLLRESNGVTLTRAACLVSEAVRAEINMRKIVHLNRLHEEEEARLCDLKKASTEPNDTEPKQAMNPSPKTLLMRAKRNSSSLVSAINYAAACVDEKESDWSSREQVMLGTRLIDLLMSIAKVKDPKDAFVPAICHSLRVQKSSSTKGSCKVGMLYFTDVAVESLKQNISVLSDYISPKQQPMIVKPRPWTSPSDGAYLRCQSFLVRRTPGSSRELEQLLRAADLTEVFDGLNALGEQEWQVNRNVLDSAQTLWDDGGGIAGLVTKRNCEVPERERFIATELATFEKRKSERELWAPRDGDEDDGELSEEFDEKRALKKLRNERRRAHKLNRELVSMRADTEHRMQQAQQFANEERIWLPHNVDFRGRAYPMPVHLQHMGCDLTRALLTFAKPGVELGERGVYWLKVHLANQLGADKMSFEERIAVAEENFEQAMKVGRDPMGDSNLEWWSGAEDPFQLLAVCFELAEAGGRFGSEQAMHGFESCLPVTMDGSCNGLQHYAALGRDVEGGTQVNLVPNERPQDVYTGIAKLVSNKVDELAEQGDEFGLLLKGKVNRKVVKQTVMTSVYGVTRIGARQQIMNRLAEIDGIGEEKIFMAASKLAGLTLSSLGDIFRGATETMDWLYDSAKEISRHGHQVQWTTPIGLPVVQPYRRSERKVVQTLMQRVTVVRNGEHTPVSTIRQRSAFPPNFVHSIDSAHMLLTGLECRRRGIQFAAVHDSFWTNAAHVDLMAKVLRDEFVTLHERDLLTELREHFCIRYPDVDFAEVPPRGELDLDVVRRSPYFFS